MQFSYTAQDAYDASVNNFEAQLEKNRIELDNLIKTAISKGQFSVIYDRETTNNAFINTTKAILNQLGYKVTEKTIKNKNIWIVSWEHPGIIDDEDDPFI